MPRWLAPICKRSDALPFHCALSAMISRTRGHADPFQFSMAARRFRSRLAGATNIGLLPVLRV
jgi:hypothetical protein